jgi:hypothetical protein
MQEHSHRERLFASRTRRRPDANGIARGFAREHLGDFFAERIEGLAVAKEIRNRNEQVLLKRS